MDDIEFEQKLRDKDHRELINTIKGIRLPEYDNSGVIAAIERNNKTIATFADKLQSLTNQSAPDISIVTNQDQVISALASMAAEINKNLNILIDKLSEERPLREFHLQVIRDNGYLSGIKVKELKAISNAREY